MVLILTNSYWETALHAKGRFIFIKVLTLSSQCVKPAQQIIRQLQSRKKDTAIRPTAQWYQLSGNIDQIELSHMCVPERRKKKRDNPQTLSFIR